MKALSIAYKDLQILSRDRGLVIQLFLLPLLFVFVFGGALTELGSSEPDTRVTLAVVDLDGGRAAQTLLQGLEEAGGVRIELQALEAAQAALDENEIPRMLVIPAGLSAHLDEGLPATLRLISHPDANPQQTQAVGLVVEGVVNDMSLEIQLLAALAQMGAMQAGAGQGEAAFSVERMQAQARSQFEAAQTQPLVAVAQRVPGQDEEQEQRLRVGDIAVPGVTVLFVFMAAQTTARSIYDEKRVGSFRRLLAAPVGKTTMLVGKLLPNVVVGLIQVAVIFGFGTWGLGAMGLTAASLGPHPLVTLLAVVVIVICSSALGITIAALARTENQIGGVSMVLLWAMGLLGGSLVPLFLLERFLGPVPRIVPHYWANHALVNLMVRGLGLADVAVDLAVLLGFSALFFGIGVWRFEFD
ncbi:MAG: ABC transporter permease [Anaerolineae bacterium]|nr:ABC transporter permease [Anaerolineae bacterium]